MTLSQTIGNDLCRKLRGVGLSKEETLPLVNLITKQVAAEGPESVVKRLKVLKQAGVDTLAGKEASFPWIAHTPKGPKGPWRPVFSKLTSSSYKHRKRALNALMVYASLVLPKRAAPTATQERKFMESVEHSSAEASLRNQNAARFCQHKSWREAVTHLTSELRRSGWKPRLRVAPDAIAYILRKKGDDAEGVAYAERQLNAFLGSDAGRPFHPFPEVLEALGEWGEDYFSLVHPYHNRYGDWRESAPPPDPVGVIGSTQEPGFKFRAFASPNLILQAALEPLKESLLSAVDLLSCDCTHDQDKGVRGVKKWLSRGDTVYAVDLSDATNNFPLVLQLELLRSMGVPESSVRLLELVSRAPYRKMWKDRGLGRWDIGQPLGAGPSFPAFALAHTALALSAGLRAGMKPSEALDSFFVLGDDFVTNDGALHRFYRDALKELSCPISESKCLESAVASEFAGKLIFADHVLHGYKYREMSDRSFLDTVRTLGRQSISRQFLTDAQYQTCLALIDIPEPYGLGFNPKGIPLADRYSRYLQLVDAMKVDKPDSDVITLAELRARFAYQSKSRHWWGLEPHARFREGNFVDKVVADAKREEFAETQDSQKARGIRVQPVTPLGVVRSLSESEKDVLLPRFVPSGDPRPTQVISNAWKARKIMDELVRKDEAPLRESPSGCPKLEDFMCRVTERCLVPIIKPSVESLLALAATNPSGTELNILRDMVASLRTYGIEANVFSMDGTCCITIVDSDLMVNPDSPLTESRTKPKSGPSCG